MVSKNLIKLANSLQLKKNRAKEKSFFVEGSKSVAELLDSSIQVRHLIATEEFISHYASQISEKVSAVHEATEVELAKIGTFQSNRHAIAIAEIPDTPPPFLPSFGWVIALDAIRDPGNLGTIIRIADWFGIKQIFCSSDTVDLYNPKVINSSMGSFLRVSCHYMDLQPFLSQAKIPIVGAVMDGQSLHTFSFPKAGIVIIGNEAQGLSQELEALLDHRLTIPAFGGAESLNAGVATALFCDAIRRQYSGI